MNKINVQTDHLFLVPALAWLGWIYTQGYWKGEAFTRQLTGKSVRPIKSIVALSSYDTANKAANKAITAENTKDLGLKTAMANSRRGREFAWRLAGLGRGRQTRSRCSPETHRAPTAHSKSNSSGSSSSITRNNRDSNSTPGSGYQQQNKQQTETKAATANAA